MLACRSPRGGTLDFYALHRRQLQQRHGNTVRNGGEPRRRVLQFQVRRAKNSSRMISDTAYHVFIFVRSDYFFSPEQLTLRRGAMLIAIESTRGE